MIHGLSERLTKGGIPVLRLHYSASAEKRPGTEAGDRWLKESTQGYPGGTKSPRWRKEMEIEYAALSGTKLFPLWEEWQGNSRIIIPPFEAHGYTLYGSYDHGWRHPSCYLVHGINGDGEIVTVWEFWGEHVPYVYIAKIIKGESVRLPDGRHFQGNPYAGQEILKIADMSIWAEDKPQSDNTMKSTAHLFHKEGVHFIKAERGGDTTVAEWLHGYWWKDPMKPLWRITTACPKLIWEFGQQRHKDFSAQVALNRAQPEELIDKDNDCFDAFKYFALRFPPKPLAAQAIEKPNTFMWWRELAKRETTGEALPTFQRELV